MIIRSLFIFALLLASVWLGIQLHHDPGYLLIAIDQWTIETTLWVAIPCLILIVLILHTLLSILHGLARIPTSWRNWRQKQRTLKAQAKTRQGLIEFSEGHWLQAKNHLIKALPFADTPLLNYLTAARAAQEMGDNNLRDNYLREAQQSMPEAKVAVELTQAQLQLANHQWEQALATLRHLQDLAPHHPYVLKLLMHLYEEVNDWQQLITLLPALKRNHVLSEPAFDNLQRQTYLKSLRELIKQNQSEAIASLIKKSPKFLMHDSEFTAEYCRYLLSNHEDTQAELILRRSLHKQFNQSLVDLYGLIKSNHVQLKFAESLLKIQPHSASLYLCLGRISLSESLWGKARTYFEESIKLDATPAAYAELGQLLEQLNDQTGACTAYRKGLLDALVTKNSRNVHGINL